MTVLVFTAQNFLTLTKKFQQFIKIVAKYTIINDKKMNLNIFINLDKKYWFIKIMQNTIDKEKRLHLKSNSIVCQRTILCRDTFCFCVKIFSFKTLQYVVKFFWIFDKRRLKIDFYSLKREQKMKKKMKKLVKIFYYYHIMNTADMRERLKFEKFYVFWNIILNFASYLCSLHFFFLIIW